MRGNRPFGQVVVLQLALWRCITPSLVQRTWSHSEFGEMANEESAIKSMAYQCSDNTSEGAMHCVKCRHLLLGICSPTIHLGSIGMASVFARTSEGVTRLAFTA